MSLDISLTGEKCLNACTCSCGHVHQKEEIEVLYSTNITHNLRQMAEEAGIYKAVWYPEEVGITKAGQIVELLKTGIGLMMSDPERFKKHNAPNGWGTYDNFLPWLQEYLIACQNYPDTDISVSR